MALPIPARNAGREPEGLREVLAESRLERFIGVIYRPESELISHYLHAELARRFDAYVWFEATRAVDALASGVGEDAAA